MERAATCRHASEVTVALERADRSCGQPLHIVERPLRCHGCRHTRKEPAALFTAIGSGRRPKHFRPGDILLAAPRRRHEPFGGLQWLQPAEIEAGRLELWLAKPPWLHNLRRRLIVANALARVPMHDWIFDA